MTGGDGRLVLCRPAVPAVGSVSDHERPASAVLPCSAEALAADAQILVRSVFPAAEIAGTDADDEWRRRSATDVQWCCAATRRASRLHWADHRARCCDSDAELVSGHSAAELPNAEPAAGDRRAHLGGMGRAGCGAGPDLP